MTGEVILIFLAIAFVWAVLGPSAEQVKAQPRKAPRPPNKNYEEGENEEEPEGPPNVVNHTPRRKKKPEPVEEETSLASETFTRMMSKEKNNVRFE